MRTHHVKPTPRTLEHRQSLQRKRVLDNARIKEQMQELLHNTDAYARPLVHHITF